VGHEHKHEEHEGQKIVILGRENLQVEIPGNKDKYTGMMIVIVGRDHLWVAIPGNKHKHAGTMIVGHMIPNQKINGRCDHVGRMPVLYTLMDRFWNWMSELESWARMIVLKVVLMIPVAMEGWLNVAYFALSGA